LLFNIGQTLSFTIFSPFMLLGMYAAWRTRDPQMRLRGYMVSPEPVLMTLLFVAFYTVLHVLTWAMPRYRLPVDAVLVSFAALGLLVAWQWLEGRIGKIRKSETKVSSLP
jgi:hypothetical protein